MQARTRVGLAAAVVGVCVAGGASAVFALGHRPAADAADGPVVTTPTVVSHAPARPLRVTGVTHATAATAAAALGTVSVTFSAAVDESVRPVLSPALAGHWTRTADRTLTFRPATTPLPGQKITLSVPAGSRGVDGGRLAAAFATGWQTRGCDQARLQQLLAEDGYLPLAFTPADAEPATAGGLVASAYAPVAGSYAWRFAAPPTLTALYTGAHSTLLTRGALLAFQTDHHLAADGAAGPRVWSALTEEVAAHRGTTAPYTYVLVSKSRPEKLTLFQNGRAVLTTPANTGVARAETPNGSWAVYARYRSQTMSGTNPDGSHYRDPGVPWISYFYGGDAVHGFPRSSYGSPQSVGCVELPISAAEQVYELMDYGDIVTVTA